MSVDLFVCQAFLLLFRLQGMEAVVQFDDSEKVISGQLSQVQVHQLGNIGYDDFYDKFLSGKGWKTNLFSSTFVFCLILSTCIMGCYLLLRRFLCLIFHNCSGALRLMTTICL